MSNNTKIFSEAIAEAKAIRETAMANAKLALEEAFAPRIQEMMSDKLEAMSYEENEMEESYGKEEMNNEEISLEELLAELEGLEEGKEEMEEGKEEMEEGKKEMEENTIAEAEDDDEVGTISVDELKDIIRDIMADVMGGGEEMEADEEMETGEEMEAGEDDLELEEILAEIASLEEGDDEMEEGLKDTAKKVGDKISKGFDKFYDAGQKVASKIAEPGSATKAIFREEELDEYGSTTMKEPSDAAAGGAEAIAKAIKSAAAKTGKSTEALYDKISKSLFGAEGMPRFEAKELDEAMSTIATLRSELNEVNLLNAKLLYVNKLFKAKNLNEAQKVKVINAFDRAETVREAKNVYDTLSESLSTEKAKSQIKESLSFASKAAGVADRKPIMENIDSTTARWQKLAGIIK